MDVPNAERFHFQIPETASAEGSMLISKAVWETVTKRRPVGYLGAVAGCEVSGIQW